MTTVSSDRLTILDVAKLQGVDGMKLNIAELLSKKKGMLQDIPWKPTDMPESHLSGQRTSLPSVSNVVYNEAIAATKATAANTIEVTMGSRVWLTPDVDVLNYGGNPGGKMADQIMSATEAIKQELQANFVTANGDTTPGDIYGFYTRYGSLSGNNARCIVDCDGTGSDNASILYVRWSPETIYGIHPKGVSAGLETKDFGEVPVTTSSGEIVLRKVRLTYFYGLSIDDWRQAARACNIDVPALLAGTGADLPERMNDLMTVVEDNEHGQGAFYMNRTVFGALRRQSRRAVQTGGGLNYGNVGGQDVPNFNGVPVRIIDDMPITETRVT